MSQGSNRSDHRIDPTQMVKESVIETVINFAFLLTGRLEYVDNVKGMDMLTNFKFACLNFCKNSGTRKIAEFSLLEQSHASDGSGYLAGTQRQSQQALHEALVSRTTTDQTMPSHGAHAGNDVLTESATQRKYYQFPPSVHPSDHFI